MHTHGVAYFSIVVHTVHVICSFSLVVWCRYNALPQSRCAILNLQIPISASPFQVQEDFTLQLYVVTFFHGDYYFDVLEHLGAKQIISFLETNSQSVASCKSLFKDTRIFCLGYPQSKENLLPDC